MGGKQVNMGQMCAILRSFGARYGYYDPRDWRQASLIDPICEVYGDLLGGLSKVMFAPDDAKAQLCTELQSGVAPKYHGLIEKTLCSHNGKFVAGDKVTIADFVLASHIANNLNNPKNPCQAALQATLAGCPKF